MHFLKGYLATTLLVFCSVISTSAQTSFQVDNYRFEDGGIGVGMSCKYHKPGTDGKLVVYTLSYTSKAAAIKINGKMQILKQVGGKASDLFANVRYSVSLATDKGEEIQHGTIIVTDKKTHKKLAVRVEGQCSI